ncbi:anti sigma factor C-terminal domain-containing protein [Clostridium sp. DL1XJH146]
MSDNFEDLFDDEKLEKSIKKGKRNSTIKIIIISIIVGVVIFVMGMFINTKISMEMSENSFNNIETITKLTVPKGYISNSIDILGFLGGSGNYSISKTVGNKTVVLKENISNFGVFSSNVVSRYQGIGIHASDDWPENYWENGYRKMIFFHPDIDYKEYKNDLALLDEVPDGKIIEMGISFDNKYSVSEVYSLFPEINKTWIWINAFTDKEMEEYKMEANEYDPKACYIDEFNISGISITDDYYLYNDTEDKYQELLDLLKTSTYARHNEIYNELVEKGKESADSIECLGVIVQGTKEDLKELLENPHIKASSFGVIVDKY